MDSPDSSALLPSSLFADQSANETLLPLPRQHNFQHHSAEGPLRLDHLKVSFLYRLLSRSRLVAVIRVTIESLFSLQ